MDNVYDSYNFITNKIKNDIENGCASYFEDIFGQGVNDTPEIPWYFTVIGGELDDEFNNSFVEVEITLKPKYANVFGTGYNIYDLIYDYLDPIIQQYDEYAYFEITSVERDSQTIKVDYEILC